MPSATFYCDNYYDSGVFLPNLANNILWLGRSVSSNTIYYGFFRFRDVAIPNGATVTSAYITLQSSGTFSTGSINEGVFIENADDPTTPATQVEYLARDMIGGTEWTFGSVTNGATYNSPDISAYVQTILARPGWSSGNHLQSFIYWTSGDEYTARTFNKSYGARLFVEWENVGSGSDILTASDALHAQSLTGYNSDIAVSSDSFHGYSLRASLSDSLIASDSYFLQRETVARFVDALVASGAFSASAEKYSFFTDVLSVSDQFHAFNWSAWWRRYGEHVSVRYFLYLTGRQNNLAPALLPISSFQTTMRQGTPTYLNAVVPALVDVDGNDYYTIASARPDGQLRIVKGFVVNGTLILTEEIVRVLIEDIRTDQGPKSQSMTLTGHSTYTWDGKYITITHGERRYISGGKLTIKTPVIDPYIRPGDIVTFGTDQFTIDTVTIQASVGSQYLEVTQA